MFFPMERELFASSARNVRYYDVDASGFMGYTWWSTVFEHHKYPGLKCIMFSGEDEDYELYGDVLVREEGHGYVVVDMYTCKTWMDIRQLPNDHEDILSKLRTLLRTDTLVPLPLTEKQSSVGFLTEMAGEYHPRHYACEVRNYSSEV
jgi:hypothetical protein